MPASPIAPQHARHAMLSACIVSALPALALVGGFATAMPAFAPKRIAGATIPVTSCDDSGAGTLRDVLALAQPGDTIDLSGLACTNGEIVLTSNPLGTVTQDLEIHGPGQDQLTISGNDAHQILITFTGITISDLTIAHGTSPSGFGGCLFIGGDLTLVRSTVTGCSAGDGANTNAYGGAIDVTANLYMTESTISNSSADAATAIRGGCAYVTGNADLEKSAVVNCHAENSNIDEALGGGLNVAGDAHLVSSNVSNCSANAFLRGYGGGLLVSGAATVEDSVITLNSVAGSHAHGGGMFLAGISTLATTSTTDNQALSSGDSAFGGGIYAKGSSIAFTRRSVIANNLAYGSELLSRVRGGGVAGNNTSVSVDESIVEDNEAFSNCSDPACSVRGGGIDTRETITIARSSIIRNSARLSAALVELAYGGGAAVTAGSMIIESSTISGNHSDGRGGGLAKLSTAGGSVAIHNSTISFNDSADFGGGVSVGWPGGPPPMLTSSIVAMNEAPVGSDVASQSFGQTVTILGSNNLILDEAHGITLPFDTLRYNPHLLPLANNGGPTPTHALGSCSRAIDAGNNNAGFETDQRGEPFVRGYGPGNDPDIGAYERQPDPDAILKDGFEIPQPCS